jgi:hypothetical protein
MTDAGKRGKKVRELTVSLTFNFEGDREAWFDRQTLEVLTYARSGDPYGKIKAFISDLRTDFPEDIEISEDSLRSVDVEPYGEVFEFDIPLADGVSSLQIKSSPTNFSVRDHAAMRGSKDFFMDTGYYPAKKADAVVFYAWLKDNAEKPKSFKSISDLTSVWKKLGVNYRSH